MSLGGRPPSPHTKRTQGGDRRTGIVPISGLPNAFWMPCAQPLLVERSRMSHRVEISIKLWNRRALTRSSGSRLCPSPEVSAVLVFEPNPISSSTSPLKRLKKRAELAQGMTRTRGAGRTDGTTAASTRSTICRGFGADLYSCCLYPACTVLPPLFGSSPALLSSSRSQRDLVRMVLLVPGLLQLGVALVSRWASNLMEGSTSAIKNVGSFGWGAPSRIPSGCSYPSIGFFTPLRGWTSFFHQQSLLHPPRSDDTESSKLPSPAAAPS